MGSRQRSSRHWFLWYFIHATISGCKGEICPIPSTDCSQPGAPCVIKRDADCSLSSHYTADLYPGPVTSFSSTARYIPDTDGPGGHLQSRSNVQFTWNLPANGTHKHLMGFEVRVWPLDASKPYCFIYDLSGATWDFDDMHHQYVLNCSSLDVNQYDVEVTSLPRSDFSRMRESATIYIANKAKMESGTACHYNSCWKSDLVIYNRPCDHSLTVTFNMAPEKDKVLYYIVSLIPQDSLVTDVSQEITQKPGQTSGTVKLSVPIATTRPMEGRVIKLIPKGTACSMNRCLTTISAPFSIVDVVRALDCTFKPPLSLPVKNKSEGLSDAALGGIIIGTIMFAALCTVLIVVLARRKPTPTLGISPDTTTISTTNSNEPLVKRGTKISFVGTHSKKRLMLPRKSIYLLYANDNKNHKNVIGLFAQFLTNLCHCDVIYDMEHQYGIHDSKSNWILRAMEGCSWILMINSDGSYHRANAMTKIMFYPPTDCDSCLGDMFSPAFQILQEREPTDALRQKLIIAHFSYTSPAFRLPPTMSNVHDRKTYQLMTDLEQLYCHIHALGNDVGQPEVAKYIDELWYTETEEGSTLAQAIGYTETYMQAEPDWFRDIHGKPETYIQNRNTHPYSNQRNIHPNPYDLPLATTDSMCGEIDSINSCKPGNNIINNNNQQYPMTSNGYPQHNRYSNSSHASSIHGPRSEQQWSLPAILRPPPTKPEDTMTLNSSAMGDAVDEINDSGYRSTSKPMYIDMCDQLK